MVDEIKDGLAGARSSLAIGAGIIWLVVRRRVRGAQRGDGGEVRPTAVLTVLALIGVSTPVFLLGALMNYYLGLQARAVPERRLRADCTENPCRQWFYHLILPWTALSVLFIGVYSRVLRSNVLDTMNEDYVRTARAKGIGERQRAAPPRPAQLADPGHHALGPRLRRRCIGGGAILTETVFDLQGVGQYVAESDRPARRAAGARDHDVRRVLRRRAQRDRRHRLRAARPADPADS